MTPDDTPLVIESGNELPATDKYQIILIWICNVSRAPGRADIQVKSSHRMPDFRQGHCQKELS